jgi:hypothetical protein
MWKSRPQTQRVSIEMIDKDIQKPHRVRCLDVGIKTVREQHALRAISSVDMAQISSNEWLRFSS